jgi:ribosome-binding protein aMBF1 (putative translation factor)
MATSTALATMRRENKYTQADLARMANLNVKDIAEFDSGKSKCPMKIIEKIEARAPICLTGPLAGQPKPSNKKEAAGKTDKGKQK